MRLFPPDFADQRRRRGSLAMQGGSWKLPSDVAKTQRVVVIVVIKPHIGGACFFENRPRYAAKS
jgi:hypothetical protein